MNVYWSPVAPSQGIRPAYDGIPVPSPRCRRFQSLPLTPAKRNRRGPILFRIYRQNFVKFEKRFLIVASD